MAIYLCRWPNGEFSIVNAKTKADAIELLDEWGNAEQASLTRITDCMFDFRLGNDGQIEIADIGESTHDCIMETCYPELDKAFATADWDEAGLDFSTIGRIGGTGVSPSDLVTIASSARRFASMRIWE